MKNFWYILLLFTLAYTAQEKKGWNGYFSYSTVKDISQSATKVYGATDNAYFNRNVTTNEIQKVTTIEGLSGQTITQIYHSNTYNKTIIGHEDGLLTVVNDATGAMMDVVDILNKSTIPPNMKRINHFMEYNQKLYISTDYGISLFDLATLQFGDTYFIGSNGSNVSIVQTAIHNQKIYAVAAGYGLLKADINNPNLIDYSQWTMDAPGSWVFGESIGDKMVIQSYAGTLYSPETGFLAQLPAVANDARFVDGSLIVTMPNKVVLLDNALNITLQIEDTAIGVYNFLCATKINDKIYIGTRNDGMLAVPISNITTFSNVSPNGPERNKIFALSSYKDGFWVSYGDHSGSYNPYPLDSYGISKYDATKEMFTTIPYANLFNVKSIAKPLVNPNNNNQVYFGSSYSGVLKVENGVPNTVYNTSNSSLLTVPGQVPDDVRVSALTFDKEGSLWATNALSPNGLHVLRSSGQWQAYSLPCLGDNQLSASYGRIAVDKNGTKWIASNFFGVIGFNEKYNKCSLITQGVGLGNLPNVDARAVAIDTKNKLWIGTSRGLRVVPSVDSFLSQNQLESSSIIILEDNLAQELLFDQFISDIVVDGSNNKWIGTYDAGVFYISPDGQKTYNIFTKENSPLPSNTVIDIELNEETGEVFFATDGGLVSYNGIPTKGKEDFENVIIYPNPVRPEFNGNVIITGLMDKANVKITDIEGNLVFEKIAEGGTIEWDTRVFGKKKVASGVYMVLLSSEDGLLTKIKKVMVVR